MSIIASNYTNVFYKLYSEESLKYSMQIKCPPLSCGEFIANSQPESNREKDYRI